MSLSNNMTLLLNKLERRLGTRQLNLPDFLKKDKWVEVIKEDSLVTFSRYFPNKIKYVLDRNKMKNGYYLIDEDLLGDDIVILGVRDLSWDDMSIDCGYLNGEQYSVYDYFANPYNFEDIAMIQMRADHSSLFNNGLYLDFIPPNKIQVKSCVAMNVVFPRLVVDLLIQHNDINTISPTKMEIFEELAKADVARFLYNELKYYDGLETVYASIDIKLSDLQDAASRREDVIEKLKESYVSASNDNQPIMFTV